MNREIEFRGYNPKNRKWLYGYYLVNRGKHYIVPDGIQPPSATPEDFEVEPESIGQYTGMQDRNGKRIYEGDIVKTPLLDPIFGDLISDVFDNASISFYNGAFVVDYHEGWHRIYLQDLHDKVEIIGNVHDNPELAKTTEQ